MFTVACYLYNQQSMFHLYFWLIGFRGVDTSRQRLLREAVQNSEQALQHGSDSVRSGPGRQQRKIQCKRPTCTTCYIRQRLVENISQI